MNKSGLLNSDINRVAGQLGHTDSLCVADCGLPVPPGVERIDLAVKPGLPAFIEVTAELAQHLKIERLLLAAELETENPALFAQITALFPEAAVDTLPHADFKKETRACRAVIRTGETSPYANVILQAGCLF